MSVVYKAAAQEGSMSCLPLPERAAKQKKIFSSLSEGCCPEEGGGSAVMVTGRTCRERGELEGAKRA